MNDDRILSHDSKRDGGEGKFLFPHSRYVNSSIDCYANERKKEKMFDYFDYDEDERDEILVALGVIKKTCKRYVNCKNCPFGDKNNNCRIINKSPSNWPDVKEISPEPEIWRAFK